MWDQLSAFLDYQAIRRHVENKLASPNLILGHIVLFLVLIAVQFIYYSTPRRFETTFGEPGLGLMMAGWSVLMLLHGIWRYRRSGAVFKNRSRVIEAEFHERLEADDTELLSNPKQVFRIRGILDENIRRRATIFLPTFVFLILNSLMWVSWAIYYGATTEHAWVLTLPLAFVTLFPALLIQRRRNRQYDEQLEQLLAGREPYKQKRMMVEAEDTPFYLTDDGEISDDYEVNYPVERRKANE